MTTADFSGHAGPISLNLATAQVLTSSTGFSGVTQLGPMITGLDGWTAKPLLSVGDTVANGFVVAGKLDGIAAQSLNATTVRLFTNHELSATDGPAYTISNGAGGLVSLLGARIDYYDVNKTTMAVTAAGSAVTSIVNRAGTLVTSSAQLENGGLAKLCSSVLVQAEQFGPGRGLANTLYFAGEESSLGAGGSEWALDTATGKLWAVPDFGRGKWENVCELDTGNTSNVAFLLSDDTPGAALYLYVGTKQANGSFLARNGLSGGQLFVWASNTGETTAAEFSSGARNGSWQPLATRTIALANTPGYDAQGYKTAIKLAADADALGAFSFARNEDIDRDPNDATKAVFAATGHETFDAGANTSGTLYTIDVDFTSLTAPTGVLSVLLNANTTPGMPIRSPDNVEWSADGYIYIQEDKAADIFGPTAINTNESSILRLNPLTGLIQRIAVVERESYSPRFDDALGAERGAWETTGLIDVSVVFGKAPGTLFLSNVMAHGVTSTSLGEAGQMLFLSKPGTDSIASSTLASTGAAQHAIGSNFNDILIGNSASNQLEGRKGNDALAGRSGDDVLNGGEGNDALKGGYGADTFVFNTKLNATTNVDTLSTLSSIDKMQLDNDIFTALGTAFTIGEFRVIETGTSFASVDATDNIIYLKSTGDVYYDRDGSGTIYSAIKFADLTAGTLVNFSHFLMVE